jgi:hypothetical protein
MKYCLSKFFKDINWIQLNLYKFKIAKYKLKRGI